MVCICIVASFFTSACTPKSDEPQAKVIAQAERDADDAIAESALMVEEGEALLHPSTLNDALGKFREAQAISPENSRAGFWIAMLGPVLEIKGLLARVRPLYSSVPDGANRYARMISQQKSEAWRTYVLAGPRDIDSAEKLQEVLDRVSLKLTELRTWMRENKSATLRVIKPSALFSMLGLGAASIRQLQGKPEDCQTQSIGPLQISSEGCENGQQEVLLNRADFEMLALMAGHYAMQFAYLNAYLMSPEAIVEILKTNNERNDHTLVDRILKTNSRLPLRPTHQMSEIKTAINDLRISYEYLRSQSQSLCPRPSGSPLPRPGYLFSFGLCITVETDSGKADRATQILDAILAGEAINVAENSTILKTPLLVEVLKLVDEPIPDLSSFNPAEFNACGTPLTLNDEPLKRYIRAGRLQTSLNEANEGKPCLRERAAP